MSKFKKYLKTSCDQPMCFAYDRGNCTVLSSTFEDCFACPFKKTRQQLLDDREAAREHIFLKAGGEDLWEKYHGNDRKNERERGYRARAAEKGGSYDE